MQLRNCHGSQSGPRHMQIYGQIHKLIERGCKQFQIVDHIKDIKFSGALTRKHKDKLVLVTQYSDDIHYFRVGTGDIEIFIMC